MKKYLTLIFLNSFISIAFILIPDTTFGQIQMYPGGTGSNFIPFGVMMGGRTRIMEIKPVRQVIGSPYLYEDFKTADIVLLQDDLHFKDIPVKIDAMNNNVEVSFEEQVYLISSEEIFSLQIKDDNVIYIAKNALAGSAPTGFFKVLYNERSSLLCHYSAKFLESNYVQAFDAGRKNDKINMETNFYVYINKELTELEKTGRKFAQQFSSDERMGDFIRHNKINPRDHKDLIKFITYYDSLNSNE